MTGSASKGHVKHYHYYHCSKGCHFRIRADQVNEQLLLTLRSLVPGRSYREAFDIILRETYYEMFEKKTMTQARTIRAMEQLIDRVVRAGESLYGGAIDGDDFIAIKEDSEKRVGALGTQLKELW